MILALYIQPNAKETCFDGTYGEYTKLKVKALPVDGKANKEIIRFLSQYYRVKKAQVKIIAGLNSRYKKIEIINK
ncbi:DUF167 domain-containing protein [Thiotrichales bacterium 19S3-11]|nr:DUF167 domain-containing protein [Thiotrichales bacterium 19S3-11]